MAQLSCWPLSWGALPPGGTFVDDDSNVHEPNIQAIAAASQPYGVAPSTISGHRDHGATTCPGTHLHATIDSGGLADAVEELIAGGGVDLVWP